MRPRGIPGLGRAFVGRDREFEQLLAAYRGTVERGRPMLITMVGDAGAGKTRLARELWSRLGDEHPEPLRRTGRCLPYGRGITYWPLGEMLREHLGILESDSPDDIRRRLGDRAMLGLTLGLDIARDLHPLAARDRLQDAWIAFLDSLVAQRPVVALIEDLHWAEPPLLDLIEQLARNVSGPLLLVGTARPDFIDARAGWGTGRYQAETIWLEPLSAASAGELIDSVIGAALPEAARNRLIDRAEGNPLFIEEILASLIDRGLIERHDGTWVVNQLPAGIEIPDSVHAVVAARLDLVQPSEKAALQAAAVVGRVFWTGPVYDLIDERPDLRALEDRDFIRRRAGSSFEGEREYAFKHAITREVAYESVPKAKRARLHAAFAEWIGRRIGARDGVASMLAHHYAAAVDPDDADLAWGSEPERLGVLRQQAIRWLAKLSKPETRARAQALLALGYWQQNRPVWAVQEAKQLAERLGEAELLVDAYEVECLSEFAAGRYPSALTAAARAFDVERQISDPDARAGLRESVAALFTVCGRLPEARRVIDDHAAITRRLSPHHRLHAVALEVEFLEMLGEWRAIVSLVPRARTAVGENLATPCVRAARSLLVCGLLPWHAGIKPKGRSWSARPRTSEWRVGAGSWTRPGSGWPSTATTLMWPAARCGGDVDPATRRLVFPSGGGRLP